MIRLFSLILVLVMMAAALVRWVFPHSLRAYAGDARALVALTRRGWLAEPTVHRAALAALVLFGFLLRLVHLSQPMRYDEAWSFINYSSQPLRIALSDYSLPNNHVFHTLLAWISTRAFGDAIWAIRLPVLVAGTLLVPATYLVARRLGSAPGALFAAALAAVLPSLILYSTNARGYVIICLAFLVLLLLADSLASEDSPGLWVPFAIVMALGAYTAPVMMFPAGAAILWLVAERWRRRGRSSAARLLPRLAAALTLSGVLTAMLYAPVIVLSGARSLVSNRFVTAHGWPQFVAELPAFGVTTYETLALGVPIALAGLGAAAIFWALFRDDDGGRIARRTLAIAVVAACTVILVGTRRPPPGRVLLYVAPLLCVYAGIGLASLGGLVVRSSRRRVETLAAAAVLLALVVGAWGVAGRVVFENEETDWFGYHDAPEVARFLLSELRPGDRVVYVQVGPPLDFYLRTLGNRQLAELATTPRPTRLLVVVNEAHHQTLDLVRGQRRTIPWDQFSASQVLRRFERSRVYELHALGGPPPPPPPDRDGGAGRP